MYFTIEKITNQLRDIRRAIYREAIDIRWFKYLEEPFPGPDGAAAFTDGKECPEYDDLEWLDFKVGEHWGGYDRLAWFRTWIDIPSDWAGQKVGLHLLVGPRDGGESTAETLLYINGHPLQALDVWHPFVWLPPEELAQGRILIALKAWSGVIGVPERRQFKLAQLVQVDETTERFAYLSDTLVKAVKSLDENDLSRSQMLEALNNAFHRVDFYKPGSAAFYQSVAGALSFLEERLEEFSKYDEIKPRVVGIGHAHIDMAWLWRLRHTREKAARTFTTALHLMRQYPEYRFTHSSPQLYKFLKEDYPEIYERVKEKIASGQWEITGGMWVEADTNLTSGESLIRQFLFGMRFAREAFGVEMKTLWLPDVFGYTWALPQIAKGCGIQNFLTSKISWNQFNRFPYDTFYWRGIDGTELLTHFVTTPENGSPIYTYNGQLLPEEVKGAWENYRQKAINDEIPLLYGWGDGGGGPTQEMLDAASALQNLPGIPTVELEKAEPYLERLERNLAGKDVPVWDGELYLEYHRGTYTSQAYNKRMNRTAENLYHNAEWLSALADLLTGGKEYPVEELRAGWELILLNQFHDILPGSSIGPVYQDSREDYQRVMEIGEAAVEQAEDTLLKSLKLSHLGILVLNPLSWKRSGLVDLPWNGELERQLEGMPHQVCHEEGVAKVLVAVKDIPALGYRMVPVHEAKAPETVGEMKRRVLSSGIETSDSRSNGGNLETLAIERRGSSLLMERIVEMPGNGKNGNGHHPDSAKTGSILGIYVSPDCLENQFYRISLNEQGQITSIWDKRCNRAVIPDGARANVLQAFEDKPMNFDAWDVDIYYQEKLREVNNLVEAIVEEMGPLRGVLRLVWKFYDSTITQRMTIYRDSPRIDFRTRVDWQESQVLLKAAFSVDIRATHATYDIQFGNIERPTHWNTSWDVARFETVGHKWVDLSEGNYGVALLNDCKYGHDVHDNIMRLTLIKSATSPDANADRGEHIFTYSLLPHAGGWRDSDVVREAYDLNNPLLGYVGKQRYEKNAPAIPESFQFAQVDAGQVILETVKQAEDGDGLVVRFYEFQQNRNNRVKVAFGRPIRKAVECNLVEDELLPAEFEGKKLYFAVKPYEIKTFKIWFV